MSNKSHPPLTRSEQMAQFRLSIIGSLLASPPEQGDLHNQLSKLAEKHYHHPISGQPVDYSASTLERWYYKAKNEDDRILNTLCPKTRNDKGKFKVMDQAVCDALTRQYAAHDSWSVQLVRPDKVEYSSGCDPHSGKAGQPPDRELWVGGGDPKD